MYGERDDHPMLSSRVWGNDSARSHQITASNSVVQTVAQALKLPYAEISLKQGDGFVTAASTGLGRRRVTLPLTYGAELVGP